MRLPWFKGQQQKGCPDPDQCRWRQSGRERRQTASDRSRSMTVRNLEHVLSPKSVAVIGASDRPGSVGKVVMANILASGFAGKIWPVNPKYDLVAGLACAKSVSAIEGVPDLAIILTPADAIPGLIDELGRKGTRAAVVITAGLTRENGLRQAMLDAAKPYLFRIVGPNTVGLTIPPIGLNASFAHLGAAPGGIALLSQSGAIMTSLMDWAADNQVGFSHIVSLGDMADVDAADFLDMLAGDVHTREIVMYLESLTNPRKFIAAARAAARLKPVVAIKAGRHPEAAKAAATHTGALSSGDRIVDAALRRAGILRIEDIGELFAATETIGRFSPLERSRVGIVTNGGGAGVLLVDELIDRHCQLAKLGETTIAALDAAMPKNWSRANPVDIIGDAPPERYRAAIERTAADPDVDIVVVMNCPTGLASPLDAARAVVAGAPGGSIGGKPVLACWLGSHAAREGRAILSAGGIANYQTPSDVAAAITYLRDWSSGQANLLSAPHAVATENRPGRDAALAILRAVAADGRRMLTEPEAKAVIRAYGIATPETVSVRTPAEAETAAAGLLARTRRIAVKILSRTLTHKSDVGGVVLGIETAAAARAAAQAIVTRLDAIGKAAEIDGFTVQDMVETKNAHELILGLTRDPVLGPAILFGAGGVSVEVVNDTAIALPPLDDVLAGDVIDRTRIGRLLAGYRDRPAANRPALLAALGALSQLIVDFRCITALDINPLLADQGGVIALDARIEIDPADVEAASPNSMLAIRPVPTGWDRQVTLGNSQYLLRPIVPSDAALYPDFLARVSAEDLRLRFLSPRGAFSDKMILRLTQVDYAREMAFVALDVASGALAGIARFSADPDHENAEFALLVRSDLQGRGLGGALFAHLRSFAAADGLHAISGVVLNENDRMLAMCARLGFAVTSRSEEPGLTRVSLALTG
jgi:acetyltransferase